MHEKRFTYEYTQPADYTFCQDSVLAPLAIANDLEAHWSQPDFRTYRALDLCAGCGVMGLELTHALPQIRHFEFLEIQSAFREPFSANSTMVQKARALEHEPLTLSWLERPYADLQSDEFRARYDLVVCNPPYFDLGEGTLPSNPVKQRARFFVDDSLGSLLKSIRSALKPQGRAYVLLKSGKKHGRDAFTLARNLLSDCDVTILADIRGTDLVRIVAPKTS